MCGAEPFGELRERTAARESGGGGADRVERRALDRSVRRRQGFAVRQRVGEQRLLGFEGDVLACIVEAGGLDLVDLKAQQVELTCTGPLVAAEPGELGIDSSHLGSGGAVGGEGIGCRRAGEPVERGALHRRCEEGLVRVLAVKVDEASAHLGELADGCEAPVDVGAAAAVQRYDARQHDFVAGLAIDESTFDARFGGAVAHERRVGASSDEQLDRFDQQRLARAGLAGDPGEPATEHEREIGDDAEVGDMQFGQHAGGLATGRRGRTWPSGSGGSRAG